MSARANPTQPNVGELPIVVRGRRIQRSESGGSIACVGPAATAYLPQLDDALLDVLLAQSPDEIAEELSVQDVVAFLDAVGRNWRDVHYPRRRMYVELLAHHLGWSREMANAEADLIAVLLSSRGRLQDQLAAELGSRHILDSWVRVEETQIRAHPRGRCLHILSGNSPSAVATSLVRALITKNVSILKAASGDPVTPIFLALSLADVDDAHPVCASTSALYLEPGDESRLERLVRASDVVCAWGGREATEWVRRHAPPQAELLLFGPKRSVALVGCDADVERASVALAHDIVRNEQGACFSTREVFVVAPLLNELVARLGKALSLYESLFPVDAPSMDARANRSLIRREHEFLEYDTHWVPGEHWTIVVSEERCSEPHPLLRTVFVHSVPDLMQAVDSLGPDVQTVACAPWELAPSLRDGLARRGISRIVEVGLSNITRVGSPHDGFFPLQRLVRLVALEDPSTSFGKGLVVPLNQSEILQHARLTDLVP